VPIKEVPKPFTFYNAIVSSILSKLDQLDQYELSSGLRNIGAEENNTRKIYFQLQLLEDSINYHCKRQFHPELFYTSKRRVIEGRIV
jgi:hypothetical protein